MTPRPVAAATAGHEACVTIGMNPAEDHRDEAPGQLISGVLSDARDLAVAEVDKLKAEAITQVKEVGEEAKLISVAALILAIAAMMLAVAFALGLARLGLPAWSAFGIVAIAYGVTGTVFLKWRAITKTAET
jgi:hypothetical protein